MPDFLSLEPFLSQFDQTIQRVNKVLELLKHQGLSAKTYESIRGLLAALRTVEVKEALDQWLTQQMAIQRLLGSVEDIPLLVSSDIIESLFGKFKYAMSRCPSLEINRSTLLIPALCGHLERDSIAELLREFCARRTTEMVRQKRSRNSASEKTEAA